MCSASTGLCSKAAASTGCHTLLPGRPSSQLGSSEQPAPTLWLLAPPPAWVVPPLGGNPATIHESPLAPLRGVQRCDQSVPARQGRGGEGMAGGRQPYPAGTESAGISCSKLGEHRVHLAWQWVVGRHVSCRGPAASELSPVYLSPAWQCQPGRQGRRNMSATAKLLLRTGTSHPSWAVLGCPTRRQRHVCSGTSLLPPGSPWSLSPWLGCAHHGSRAGPDIHRALGVQPPMEGNPGELCHSCGQVKQLFWLGLQG